MPQPTFGAAAAGAATPFHAIARAAGLVAAVLGLTVLSGHAAGIDGLISLSPGDVPMTPNTALGLIVAGAAIVFATKGDRSGRPVGVVFALAVTTLGMAVLLEYVTGQQYVTFSIGPAVLRALGGAPGQMPLLTGAAMALLGGSILAFAAHRNGRLTQPLALAAIVCGFVSTISYLYDSGQVAEALEGARMALSTGIAFIILGIAVMLARPDRGLVALLRSETPSGITARRMFPFVVAAPALLAWVRLWGQRAGWYGTEFGISLMVVSMTVLLAGLVWATSLRLERVEKARLAEEQARRMASRQLSEVQTLAHIGSWTLDVESGTVSASDEMARLWGVAPGTQLGVESLWSLVHPADFERVKGVLERSVATGEVFSVENRIVVAGGIERNFLTRGFGIAGPDGSTRWLVGLTLDLTDLRHAEDAAARAEDRYRQIVQGSPEGVWTIGGDMRTTLANPALLSMLRCDEKDLLGADPGGFVHHADRAALMARFGRLGRDPEVTEVRLVRGDATKFWSRLTITPFRSDRGSLSGCLVTVIDIDAKRSADEALRNAYEQERAATEQLRMLDAMKNNLLTAVSHELRTPLTGVLGFAATLEAHIERLTEQERAHVLERLLANARKLDRLLSDLLDLDRISRGLLGSERHRARVDEIMRGVIADVEVRDRRLHVDLPRLSMSVDASKVERIVENLLSNAIRYTPPGSNIWVRLEGVDEGCVIVVEDEGPGVSDEDKELVFEPFRRGSASSPHSPGTGVGLSLVSRFAALHGGTAWVQDRPGGGASFRVTLAAQRQDADRVA